MKHRVLFFLLSFSAITWAENWQPDEIPGFFATTIRMGIDYEDIVESTVITDTALHKDTAVIYLHGFSDYFFQQALADSIISWGYGFYGLDLRKCGRSLREHQHAHNIRHIPEYFPDIDTAIMIARKRGSDFIIILAHSTGGLTASHYVALRKNVDKLVLNSPFFDFNMNFLMKRVVIPLVSNLGKKYPFLPLPNVLSTVYGESIHQSRKGSWQYNLSIKPLESFPVNAGWINAIYSAQKKLRQGLNINIPILIMHSSASVMLSSWDEKARTADAVLAIEDMKKYGRKLGANVSFASIEGGLHDLFLSETIARNRAYLVLKEFLKK